MGERIDFLSVPAEEAEHEELLRGVHMSTREKFEFFEEILDLAWRTGAIKYLRSKEHVERIKDD